MKTYAWILALGLGGMWLGASEVAKKMQKTKSTIINWEKGRTSMKISDFEELCNLYRISKDYIILPTTLQKVE